MPVVGNADELIPECAKQDFAAGLSGSKLQRAAAIDILGRTPMSPAVRTADPEIASYTPRGTSQVKSVKKFGIVGSLIYQRP